MNQQVKNGRYPGGPKAMIHSQRVINGGATDADVNRLWRQELGEKRWSGRSGRSGVSGRSSPNGYSKEYGYSPMSPVSTKSSRRY